MTLKLRMLLNGCLGTSNGCSGLQKLISRVTFFQVLSSVVVPEDADCPPPLHPLRSAGGRRELPGVPAAVVHRDAARDEPVRRRA